MLPFGTRILASALLALLVVAGLGTSASAQPGADQRIESLLEQAFDAYDMLQLQAAQARLQEAIDFANQSGRRSRAVADCYVMLGVVRYAISGNDSDALDPFVQALLIDDGVEVHPYYATPTLEELLAQARNVVPRGGTPATPPPAQTTPPPAQPPTPPAQSQAPVINHQPIRDSMANAPIRLAATVPISVPVSRVAVNFRAVGSPNYFAVDMVAQPDGVSFLGEIPASATRGATQIDYYLTVQDRAGNVLGAAGGPQQPFSIVLLGGYEASTRGPAAPYVGLPGLDEPTDREVAHFSLSLGSGVGLATSEPNVYADEVRINPGLALTPIHIGAEASWSPTDSFHLVPFLRTQLVIRTTGIDPLFLGGIKARYFLVNDREGLRLYAQGGLGYGDVSHLVYLAEKDTYDTTNEGPYHIGGGGGLVYMFTRNVGLQIDLYAMTLFDRFSFQLDGQLGLYFGF
jgi:hypothetical protein